MDLISRQALAEHKFTVKECEATGEAGAYRIGWNDAIDAIIDNEPSAEPENLDFHTYFRIGETLVDVSKQHITAEQGIEKIRDYMQETKKPERKKGKWIDDGTELGLCCSECQKSMDDYVESPDYIYLREMPNFCPNCGAKMEEQE